MYEFVAQHMVGSLVGHPHREDHAVAQPLCHAASAHADIAHDGIGLLKAGVVAVDQQGIFFW